MFNCEFIVSGDDFGLSEGITNNILEAHDQGELSSASIMANGYAFEYAIKEKKKRPNLRLAIHLNLIEGKPLSSPEKIPLLVNSKGLLNNSFFTIWVKYCFGNSERKKQLIEQITYEFDSQIQRVKKQFDSNFPINIDSHHHAHLVPFIMETLISLHSKFKFNYIRIPYEPLFISLKKLGSLKNYFGVNLIKHLLLNLLSRWFFRTSKEKNLNYCDYFIGVLFTGVMSKDVVIKALSKIKEINPDCKTVEILFHPGEANKGEESYWEDYPGLKKYYFSTDRKKERIELKSTLLKETISYYQRI